MLTCSILICWSVLVLNILETSPEFVDDVHVYYYVYSLYLQEDMDYVPYSTPEQNPEGTMDDLPSSTPENSGGKPDYKVIV